MDAPDFEIIGREKKSTIGQSHLFRFLNITLNLKPRERPYGQFSVEHH